jgi:hypothetical protein
LRKRHCQKKVPWAELDGCLAEAVEKTQPILVLQVVAAVGDISVRIGIRYLGKSYMPARGSVGCNASMIEGQFQQGQLFQMKNTRGSNGFSAIGFRCLASGKVDPAKNPAREDRGFVSL